MGDAVVTVVLFVVLVPAAVAFSVFFGLHMFMLGDGYPTSRVSTVAILGAVVMPVVGAVGICAGAVVWAFASAGPTFHIPLIAGAGSALWTLGVGSLGAVVVGRFR